MIRKYFILTCICLFTAAKTQAQNVSSPYSILGVGDIETNDYGRYSASGGAAVSRREPGSYNFSNPASLTALSYKTLHFDFGLRGKVSSFKLTGSDTLTQPSKDFAIKRVSLAFKVTPKTAFAFGLKPFSTVNFQYIASSSISDGNADYLKYTEGTGGINQVYFSIANEVKSRLSVGATAFWLFGSLQNSIEYYNPNLGLDIIRNESNFYNSAGLQAGLQYYTDPTKKWRHSFGLTSTAYTTLKGEKTADYTEFGTIIKTVTTENVQFKMPVSIMGGYSIAHENGLSFHLQGDYYTWATRKLNYKNTYIKDAYSLRAGFEYSKKVTNSKYTQEKFYLAMGVKMEQSYLVLNNNHLNDYAVTLGAGKNVSRFLSLHAGFDAGRRGSKSLNQIQENYYQFTIGFTLKAIWFGTRKTGRFNYYFSMKKILLLIICFISTYRVAAQKIDGLWYSSDSSRVYEIKKTTGNKYNAVIKSSTRKNDRPGYIVIKDLEYNARRKRYEGVIYAVENSEATFVKIRFTNTNKIVLKLSRMFVFDLSINWIRASA